MRNSATGKNGRDVRRGCVDVGSLQSGCGSCSCSLVTPIPLARQDKISRPILPVRRCNSIAWRRWLPAPLNPPLAIAPMLGIPSAKRACRAHPRKRRPDRVARGADGQAKASCPAMHQGRAV